MSPQEKAHQYLIEGRVLVVEAGESWLQARVQGSSPVPYRVQFRGEWSCDCPARVVCSHVLAVQLVSPLRSTGMMPLSPPDPAIAALLG